MNAETWVIFDYETLIKHNPPSLNTLECHAVHSACQTMELDVASETVAYAG